MRVFLVKQQEIKYTLHNEAWGGVGGKMETSDQVETHFSVHLQSKLQPQTHLLIQMCLSLSYFEKYVDTSGVPALVFRAFFSFFFPLKMKSYATCKDVLLRRNAAFHLASGHILHNSIPCCGKVFTCVFNECLNTKALFFFSFFFLHDSLSPAAVSQRSAKVKPTLS